MRRRIMKMIEAVIMPVKLDEVRSALNELGIEDFMESALFCHGRQKGKAMLYRGAEYMTNFVEKVKLEIIAADDSVGKIIKAIGAVAKTERSEDCRIFILPFVEVC
jgi:nitrogen regulatory protein PII